MKINKLPGKIFLKAWRAAAKKDRARKSRKARKKRRRKL